MRILLVEDDELALPESEIAQLKVALLGCGTVGGVVYQRLAELPKLFKSSGLPIEIWKKHSGRVFPKT